MESRYIFFSFLLLSLLTACSTRQYQPKPVSQLDFSGQVDIHQDPAFAHIKLVREVQMDTLEGDKPKLISWQEDGHKYAVDITGIYEEIYPSPTLLNAVETLEYSDGVWMRYSKEALSHFNVSLSEVVFSMPGEVLVFRGKSPLGHKRSVSCLIDSRSMRSRNSLSYLPHDLYLSENMVERELLEEPERHRILVLDHFRDRNADGDLKILYVMQEYRGKKDSAKAFQKQLGFERAMTHHRLFEGKLFTFENIRRRLTPLTISLLKYTRYKDFQPRGKSEEISDGYLQEEQDLEEAPLIDVDI